MTTHRLTPKHIIDKLPAVTRETKLTLSIALNPKIIIIVTLLWSEIMGGYNTPDTVSGRDMSVEVGRS